MIIIIIIQVWEGPSIACRCRRPGFVRDAVSPSCVCRSFRHDVPASARPSTYTHHILPVWPSLKSHRLSHVSTAALFAGRVKSSTGQLAVGEIISPTRRRNIRHESGGGLVWQQRSSNLWLGSGGRAPSGVQVQSPWLGGTGGIKAPLPWSWKQFVFKKCKSAQICAFHYLVNC